MKPNAIFLADIALFASLSAETLARLEQQSILRHYKASEYIQFETDPAKGAFFIAAGRVQILRTSAGGREQVLANLGPGEAFNIVPLLRPDGTNPAAACALTAVQIWFFPRDAFLFQAEHSPDLAFALLRDFAGKLSNLTSLVEQLSLHSIRGRLARFLVEQADLGEKAERWTQDEMAARLGTVRDVVGRTLRAFEDAGLVQRKQGRIILLDRKAIEAEAEQ